MLCLSSLCSFFCIKPDKGLLPTLTKCCESLNITIKNLMILYPLQAGNCPRVQDHQGHENSHCLSEVFFFLSFLFSAQAVCPAQPLPTSLFLISYTIRFICCMSLPCPDLQHSPIVWLTQEWKPGLALEFVVPCLQTLYLVQHQRYWVWLQLLESWTKLNKMHLVSSECQRLNQHQFPSLSAVFVLLNIL